MLGAGASCAAYLSAAGVPASSVPGSDFYRKELLGVPGCLRYSAVLEGDGDGGWGPLQHAFVVCWDELFSRLSLERDPVGSLKSINC